MWLSRWEEGGLCWIWEQQVYLQKYFISFLKKIVKTVPKEKKNAQVSDSSQMIASAPAVIKDRTLVSDSLKIQDSTWFLSNSGKLLSFPFSAALLIYNWPR